MRPSISLRSRRRQKGALAAETALSLIIVITISIAGIQFSDAMFIRQQLGAAATTAARQCATRPEGEFIGCSEARARVPLQGLIDHGRCAVDTEAEILPDGTLPIGVVRVTCVYNFDWLSSILGNMGMERMRMSASSAMPLQNPTP